MSNFIGKKVIIRADRAGVFFGTLKEKMTVRELRLHFPTKSYLYPKLF